MMRSRKTEDIQELLDAVRDAFGPHCIVPYGDSDDPLSVGFRICGIPATFSVILADGLPERHYSIQIESYPPEDMDYLYYDRAISLWAFLDLLKHMSGPKANWPQGKR